MVQLQEQADNEGYEPLSDEQLSQAVCGKKFDYLSGLGVWKLPPRLQATSNENASALYNELESTKTKLQTTQTELQETETKLQNTKNTLSDLSSRLN